ncbi:MAG: NADH-quinone oxidoreductase subunit A [Actinomycetota bacterium]|jgi:NADH-quinone oxidoreductase subunit A|nr:NADH-quinone oxidoreductase subunit A [Actinomycetota bacterium]MDQ3527686.1 NADH-quinone oxidoreductase subunit A [Actinomycetota bacterium]
MADYLVVLAVVLSGLLLVAAAGGARRLLAPHDPTPAKRTTYESGVDPVGHGWEQGSVRYFVYTLLYVVFAVDVVYLFPWALVLRTDLGAASLVEMAIFLGVLLLGLAHVWRRGLLRWV